MKLQELYNEEQKLLDKLRNTTDPRKQKLIKTRISWINTMIEKLEEKEKEKKEFSVRNTVKMASKNLLVELTEEQIDEIAYKLRQNKHLIAWIREMEKMIFEYANKKSSRID
mgnify:FL=1